MPLFQPLAKLLRRRASFLGHLSGILAGYLISSGLFDALGPWGALGLLGAALAGAAARQCLAALDLLVGSSTVQPWALQSACGPSALAPVRLPAGVAAHSARQGQLHLASYIQLPGGDADEESGGGGGGGALRIVNGVIQRR